MADAYDVQAVERRWQQRWRDEGTYEIDNDDPRPPFYVLCMYPYPSGPAHQGHVRNYTFGDLIVRYRTMHGYGVLSPIGFDSFGLPAENAAIKGGAHPRQFTDERIAELTSSLQRIGAVYDWRRMVKSHDPEYIRWTQWIFLRFLERGPRLPQERAGELVPGLPDGARQRAGAGRRHLRALGGRRAAARPRAVVLPDHRLRPGAARQPGRARLARAGRHDAAQLDRAVRGRRVPHGGRRLRRPAHRARLHGLHDPPGHELRHDLLRARARAPPRRADHHGGAPRRGRGVRRAGPQHQRRSTASPRRVRSTSAGARPARSHGTRSRAGRCRSSWPTTCCPPTAPGRSWPCRGRTSGTGTSRGPTACRSSGPCSRPRGSRARRTRATARPSTASGSTGSA